MTDKVQKIREEVQKLHNLLPVMDGDNISVNYADRICTTLEMYIDSLQEEPVREELEEAANKYAKESYPDELSTGQFGTGDYEPYVDMSWQRECAVEDFKAGAKWQEKQDQSTIELAEDHAMLAGMNKMEQQMMENAIDATIGLPYENKDGGYTHLIDVSIPLPVGNNKIAIIFKED